VTAASTGPEAARPAALTAGVRKAALPSATDSAVPGQLRKASTEENRTRQTTPAAISDPPAPTLEKTSRRIRFDTFARM
jgi:hypothetical protein